MIAEFLNTMTSFVSDHPDVAGLVIFLAAATEAIAVIGSIIPGASIVLVVAGLAGASGSNVALLVVWCTAGAIVGDGLSYWLGAHFGESLKTMWPFSRRPELLRRGTDFFAKHGGKSIVIGRFLPVTRAVVPVVAGMLRMPLVRFYTANAISALAWSLVHILSAAGIGFALSLLGTVSKRLVVLVGIAAGLVILGVLLTKWTVGRLAPIAYAGYIAAVGGLANSPHPIIRRIAHILDPENPRLSAFALWITVLIVGSIGFIGVIEDVTTGDPLVQADVAINHFVQSLRTAPLDNVMVVVTAFGDAFVIWGAVLVLLAGLAVCRSWRTLAFVAAVFAGTAVFVPLLKLALHKPRPIEIYAGAETFSFPSGHATFVTVLAGILAVLASRSFKMTGTAAAWAVALCVIIIVGLSRIYLAAHWPSDVIGGMLFGLAATAVFALVTERLREFSPRPGLVSFVAVLGFAAIGSVHAVWAFDQNLARYSVAPRVVEMPLQKWLDGGWQSLPSHRIDLLGETEEPIVLQVAGSTGALRESLMAKGWRPVAQPSFSDVLSLLPASATLRGLPPLPIQHNGLLAKLVMVRERETADRRLVLRLWPTRVYLLADHNRFRVSVGSVTVETISHPFGALTVLRDRPTGPEQISRLPDALSTTLRTRSVVQGVLQPKTKVLLVLPAPMSDQ